MVTKPILPNLLYIFFDNFFCSGYGVELQIKSSEYKAQDDRKVEADGSQEGDGGDEDHEKAEEEVEGFLFDTLNELHPDKKDKLDEFKQHLKDQKNDMAPMKVWQLQVCCARLSHIGKTSLVFIASVNDVVGGTN